MDLKEGSTASLLTFISDLHHEIRSPVNTILNMTELALKQNPSPILKNYIETIEKSANTLLTILDDIIELSDANIQGDSSETSGFGICDLLDDLKESIEGPRLAKDVKINLALDYELDEWFIGPRGRIRQVLIQILNYGIRQLSSRFIKLSIGHDIQEELLEFKIITKQGVGDNKNVRLLICKRLLQDLGSDLDIRQIEGDTIFQFSVPVQPFNPKLNQGIFPRPVACVISSDQFSSPIVKRRLLKCGFAVIAASNIEEGLFSLKKEVNTQGQRGVLVASWSSSLDMDEIVDLSDYPIVFFDIPPVKMMDLSARFETGQNFQKNIGLVMSPSKGKQLIYEVSRVLELPAEDLPCQFVNEDNENIDVDPDLLKGHKILVVEDDKINQKIIVELLKRFGTKPVVASTGKTAVAAAKKHRFAAVFMDINLPDTDGYRVTEELRQIKGYENVPIIALTASTKNKKMCLEAGMNDFLSKPYSDIKLFNCLARKLGAFDKI